MAKSKVDSSGTSHVVWPSPYAFAKPYTGNVAAKESCFSRVRSQRGVGENTEATG